MNKIAKIASAAVLATLTAASGTAAFAAQVETANSAALVHGAHGGQIQNIIGFGSSKLADLQSAETVRLINVKDVYDLQTQNDVDDALRLTKASSVANLRNSFATNEGAATILASYDISPDQVLAVQRDGNAFNVYYQ